MRVTHLETSEHRRVEDASLEQVDLAHHVLNSTDDHLAVVDADGMIVEVNEAWTRFARENGGDEARCCVGANYFQECREEWGDTTSCNAAYDGLRQVQRSTLSHFEIEYPCNSPNEERWFSMRVMPLVDRPGTVLVYHTNITKRKLMERELEANVENLRLFLQHAPAAIAMFDMQMRYLAASRRWITDYRLDNRDVIGLSHYEVFPEIGEEWKEIHRQCLAGATMRRDEDPFPRADGTLDWVKWEIVPWRKADGSIGGITMFTEVITERIRSEEALRESEEKYRLLYETMLQGVVYQDADGKIISMNPAATRILGRTTEEFLGQTSESVEHGTLREDGTPFPGREHPAMEALRTGKEVQNVVMGVYNSREKGYRWISINAVPLFRVGEPTPYRVYTVFSDITEIKHAEEREHTLEAERNEFYRRTILEVTDGKLDITDAEDIRKIAGPPLAQWEILEKNDVPRIRHEILQEAKILGLEEGKADKLMNAAGEAVTNALKHAAKGIVTFHSNPDSVFVIVHDNGPGIPALSIPLVALRRGYSTKGTLGMGYKIMISSADKVYLATGPRGTSVALEKCISEHQASDKNILGAKIGSGDWDEC